MDEAEGPELMAESLVTRILAINFAAIHVGPDVITPCIYDAQIF